MALQLSVTVPCPPPAPLAVTGSSMGSSSRYCDRSTGSVSTWSLELLPRSLPVFDPLKHEVEVDNLRKPAGERRWRGRCPHQHACVQGYDDLAEGHVICRAAVITGGPKVGPGASVTRRRRLQRRISTSTESTAPSRPGWEMLRPQKSDVGGDLRSPRCVVSVDLVEHAALIVTARPDSDFNSGTKTDTDSGSESDFRGLGILPRPHAGSLPRGATAPVVVGIDMPRAAVSSLIYDPISMRALVLPLHPPLSGYEQTPRHDAPAMSMKSKDGQLEQNRSPRGNTAGHNTCSIPPTANALPLPFSASDSEGQSELSVCDAAALVDLHRGDVLRYTRTQAYAAIGWWITKFVVHQWVAWRYRVHWI